MIRHTSIEVYNQIKREGLLERFRFIVYETIFNRGPVTQNECWSYIQKKYGPTNKPSVTPNFAPLVRWGVIHEVGERTCLVSGRKCLVYDVTNNLPRKGEKKKTKDQIIKELKLRIEELEQEITMLKGPKNKSCDKQVLLNL